MPLCAGPARPVSSTSRWRGGTGACSGRTNRWACRAFQVFLLCLVYLLLECGDTVGAQSFSNQNTLWYRNCVLRVCDYAMCVEKRSKTCTVRRAGSPQSLLQSDRTSRGREHSRSAGQCTALAHLDFIFNWIGPGGTKKFEGVSKTPQTWKIGWLVLFRTHEGCSDT